MSAHLLLHQSRHRKAIDLQNPVSNMDGISNLWTNKHPSDPGKTAAAWVSEDYEINVVV